MHLKENLKEAWSLFDWNLFLFMTDTMEEDLEKMTLKEAVVCKKLYDIMMVFVMFWSFSFAAAVLYEKISLQATGMIVPNMIQMMPIYVWIIMFTFGFVAALWLGRKNDTIPV